MTAHKRTGTLWLNYEQKIFVFHPFLAKKKICVEPKMLMKLNSRAVVHIASAPTENRINFDYNIAAIRSMCGKGERVRVVWLVHNLMRTFVLARSTHTHTHTATDTERVKAFAAELCYRLEFHTPLFAFLFILHTHIVAVVPCIHTILQSVVLVCCNSTIRNAIYIRVCCGMLCMCLNEERSVVFFSFRIRLSFSFARFNLAAAHCIVCARICVCVCTAKPLTRMVRWRYRLI